VLIALVALGTGYATGSAWEPGDAAVIYDRYQDVDLDYFFSPTGEAPTGHPLFQGLKAKIDGRLDDAERHLQDATAAVPDSLQPFVYERLLA
jgi:hypothetical protein